MKPSTEFVDWGTVDYAEALARQRELFEAVLNGATGKVIFCEHPHVFTLGRSGKAENLLVSEEALRERGAALYRIERGGDVTYHGPGQIVGYPILDLEKAGLGLRQYVEALEQAVTDTVAEFGIEAGRVPGKTGVWVKNKLRITNNSVTEARTSSQSDGAGKADGVNYELRDTHDAGRNEERKTPFSSKMAGCEACDGAERGAYSGVCDEFGDERNEADGRFSRKLCAIGVRASRGVVMHGFALNVSTDLSWFGLINPCGFVGGAVTSMERETGRRIALDEVKRVLREKLFGYLVI